MEQLTLVDDAAEVIVAEKTAAGSGDADYHVIEDFKDWFNLDNTGDDTYEACDIITYRFVTDDGNGNWVQETSDEFIVGAD